MLKLQIPVQPEGYDESSGSFVAGEAFELELEHSLVSLSKWESFFCKPFLSSEKTQEETLWYVSAMITTENPPGNILQNLSNEHIEAINEYVNSKQTATTIRESKTPPREIVTAEVIYYWMVSLNIPFECEKWHLNRLIMLVKVCNEKNAPAKKMSPQEAAQKSRELNALRKAQLGTTG